MSSDLIPVSSAPLVSTPVIDVSLLAGQITANTEKAYTSDFKLYVAFAQQHNLDVCTPATLSMWRTALVEETAHSPNTINRRIKAVKRLMKEAAARGYISREAAYAFQDIAGVKESAMLQRKKAHTRTRITPMSMRRLCEAPDTTILIGLRDRALLHTLASSGCRLMEVATLTMQHIETYDEGYLLVVTGKGQTEAREAPLSREAYDAILKWLELRPIQSSFIFTSFQGRSGVPNDKQMSAVAVWQTVQRYATMCHLDHITPHSFRRFVGTQLAKSDIRQAQKALGHKRIDTTAKHYVLDELEVGMTDDLY